MRKQSLPTSLDALFAAIRHRCSPPRRRRMVGPKRERGSPAPAIDAHVGTNLVPRPLFAARALATANRLAEFHLSSHDRAMHFSPQISIDAHLRAQLNSLALCIGIYTSQYDCQRNSPSPFVGEGRGGGASEEWHPTPILTFPHQGGRNHRLCLRSDSSCLDTDALRKRVRVRACDRLLSGVP
jgi:hypothetical protein